MASLKYKTRGNANPQGKPRVYFCCHPEDFTQYFDDISNEILAKENCAFWYTDEVNSYDEELLSSLKQMQLFVMPVTSKLLCTENVALDTEFRFAVENHIPVLPLMQESGLEELFNKKCGDLQFLDKNNTDTTAISYDEKLKKYLEAVLIGDELAEKIRNAFDAYVFLSYRKKDRKYAQELMRLIHKNDFCRDIAIWYDEFLTPGENFNDAIKEALQKSGLFVLAVTPNLINETNYVMTIEYPMAKEENKLILPAELVPTDRDELSEKYEDIPTPTDAHNEIELSEALLDSIKKMAIKENDNSPEHNFFIGLAYLGGVDVEVDRERAVSLITSAADDGLYEAADQLYNMYLNGIGIERDYNKAAEWFNKKIDILKSNVKKSGDEKSYKALIEELIMLGQYHSKVTGAVDTVKKVYTDLRYVCEEAYNKYDTLYFKRKLGTSYIYICHTYIDAGEYNNAEILAKRATTLLEDISDEQWDELVKNIQTASIGQLADYYMSFNDMATLYETLAEIANKNKDAEKEENHLLRCLEYRKKVAKHFKGSDTPKLNIAISYAALTKYYADNHDFTKAVEYYDLSYPIANEIACSTGNLYAGELTVRLNMILADIRIQQDIKGDAIDCYLKNITAMEASKLTPNLEYLLAQNYYKISKLYYEIEDYTKAKNYCMHYINKCPDVYNKQAFIEMYADTLPYATDCCIKSGDYDGAVSLNQIMLNTQYQEYKNENSLSTAYNYADSMLTFGDVCSDCKKLMDAEILYKKAINFADYFVTDFNCTDAYYEITALAHKRLAILFSKQNLRSKAEKHLKKGIKVSKTYVKDCRSVEACRSLSHAYADLAQWHLQNHDYKKASKRFYDAIYVIEESISVFRDKEDICFLGELYLAACTKQGEHDNVLLEKACSLWKNLASNSPDNEYYKSSYELACEYLNK